MAKFSIKKYLEKNKEALNSKTAKVGGYSFVLTIVVLAIIIAVNILVAAIPTRFTQFDISAAQLYSLTSATKVVVTNLEKDVDIYWICQAGKEDAVIEKLLNIYDGMSDHITVTKKDPDIYPTFAKQYTDEEIYNNSLIVECGDKSRYISNLEIYEYDTSQYYSTGSVSQSFDGEGEITTAIDYCISEDLPQIYILSGHGEAALSDTFKNSLAKQNMEITEDFSLLNIDTIPEEVDALIINAPTSDLSTEEVTMLKEYMNNGGHIVVLSGPQEEEPLSNFDSIIKACGVSINDGIVIEGNRSYYAFNAPYFLLANINSSDITDALIAAKSYVIVPIAQGLTVEDTGSYTVTPLLSTSEDAFSKVAGYGITTYDKEEGDIDGPFTLAVSVENDNDGKLVWVGSSVMLDDTYNQYSSGANVDFIMNSISWMVGESDAIAIRSKSLDYSYLTISESTANWIKICLIGILPAIYLIYGLDEVLRRRKTN